MLQVSVYCLDRIVRLPQGSMKQHALQQHPNKVGVPKRLLKWQTHSQAICNITEL